MLLTANTLGWEIAVVPDGILTTGPPFLTSPSTSDHTRENPQAKEKTEGKSRLVRSRELCKWKTAEVEGDHEVERKN